LAAGKRGVALSFGSVHVVTGDNEPRASEGVGAGVVGVLGGIEVIEVAIFLGQAAIPVVAEASGNTEVRFELELILSEEAGLVGAVVAVGITLQECCCR
jgi:hypothetical protein